MRRAFICLLTAVALASCGNDPQPAPDIGVVSSPHGYEPSDHPAEGVLVRLPVNWRHVDGAAPQILVSSSGDGQIALWRYPRSEPLPETRAQLAATRTSLIAKVMSRDPTFDLVSSRLIIKRGLRAVELIGLSTNQGARRSVRSLHAYGHEAEVVIDAFSPPEDFARIDKQVFGPVASSLVLRAPAS